MGMVGRPDSCLAVRCLPLAPVGAMGPPPDTRLGHVAIADGNAGRRPLRVTG